MQGQDKRLVRLTNYIEAGNASGAKDVFEEAKSDGERDIMKAIFEMASCNLPLNSEMNELMAHIMQN